MLKNKRIEDFSNRNEIVKVIIYQTLNVISKQVEIEHRIL